MVGVGEDENPAQRTKEKHLETAGENQERADGPELQRRAAVRARGCAGQCGRFSFPCM